MYVHSPNGVLGARKHLVFMKSHLSIFPVVAYAFSVLSRKSFAKANVMKILPT